MDVSTRRAIRTWLARTALAIARMTVPRPRPILTVQASPTGTGSTVLVNLIHGILAPDEGIVWTVNASQADSLIVKTHNMNFRRWERSNWRKDVYSVVSERRPDRLLDRTDSVHHKVLIVDFDTLNETPDHSLQDIAADFVTRLRAFLPARAFPDLDDAALTARAVSRIKAMNEVYARISDQPFSVVDPFYHIHGSHRGRTEREKDATN